MVNVHRIKTLIKLKGMKIGHVCAQLGLTHTYFSNVESGKTTMSDERIYKVADILGTTYEYLTDQTGDPRLPEEIKAEQNRRMSVVDLFTGSAPIAAEPIDLRDHPKTTPPEWGLGQKTAAEVAEEAELMRIYGKLTADDKKTVLDLMRRLAGK